MIAKYLTGDEFSQGIDKLKKMGISHKKFCEYGGFSPHQIGRWRKTGAPKYAAICMSGLLLEIPAWHPRIGLQMDHGNENNR